MKNRTKMTILLLALTASMTVSANTYASESIVSKTVIHDMIQQGIDSTLDTLINEFKIPSAPVAPITPIISETKTDNDIADKELIKLEGKAKLNQTS